MPLHQSHTEDHYFLTKPTEFIFDHLPQTAQNQLLPTPISEEDFLRQPHMFPAGFAIGLNIVPPFAS